MVELNCFVLLFFFFRGKLIILCFYFYRESQSSPNSNEPRVSTSYKYIA